MNQVIVIVCVLASFAAASPFNGRIVGGSDAKLGQVPWQISMRGSGHHKCGGTILNKRWILTAAHCIERWPVIVISIAVGTIHYDDTNARVYEVAEKISHENYSSLTLKNDIALIRVAEDIEFSENVQPCELNTEDIGGDADVTFSGWGRLSYPGVDPEILQFIQLKSITNEECLNIHEISILSSNICTFTKKGEGVCYGDSGGPLVYKGKVAGIASWTRPCADGYPDVFTRVSSYIDWINERIQN